MWERDVQSRCSRHEGFKELSSPGVYKMDGKEMQHATVGGRVDANLWKHLW